MEYCIKSMLSVCVGVGTKWPHKNGNIQNPCPWDIFWKTAYKSFYVFWKCKNAECFLW